MGPKVVGPCITSLVRTEPVAAGQFISNRARVSAVLTASSDLETLSGVVLQPATNASAAIGNILSRCVFIVCTSTGLSAIENAALELSEDPSQTSMRPKSPGAVQNTPISSHWTKVQSWSGMIRQCGKPETPSGELET